MKIRYKKRWEGPKVYSFDSFFEHELDGGDYDTGVAETAQNTADNVSRALGRLVEELARRQLLDGPSVYRVATGYYPNPNDDEIATLEED